MSRDVVRGLHSRFPSSTRGRTKGETNGDINKRLQAASIAFVPWLAVAVQPTGQSLARERAPWLTPDQRTAVAEILSEHGEQVAEVWTQIVEISVELMVRVAAKLDPEQIAELQELPLEIEAALPLPKAFRPGSVEFCALLRPGAVAPVPAAEEAGLRSDPAAVADPPGPGVG